MTSTTESKRGQIQKAEEALDKAEEKIGIFRSILNSIKYLFGFGPMPREVTDNGTGNDNN